MASRIKNFVIALLATIAVWLGFEAVAVDSNITGVAPTTNTDGSALTDLASIRIYKAVVTGATPSCSGAGVTWSVLTTIPHTTPGGNFSYLDANLLANGRHCYRATALRANGIESAFSNVAFKDIDVRVPGAPTITVN